MSMCVQFIKGILMPFCTKYAYRHYRAFKNMETLKKHVHHFNFQLTHTTVKNIEILKYFKISKTAPTCFGLQGNHHQGATVSTWLKITHLVKSRYVEAVQDVVSVMAAYCDL